MGRNNRAWRGKYFARCTMRYLLLSLLLFLCVAASAAAQPRSVADLANYRGADREEILKTGGKKEGKLVWYTSLTAHREIANIFEAKYPASELKPTGRSQRPHQATFV